MSFYIIIVFKYLSRSLFPFSSHIFSYKYF